MLPPMYEHHEIDAKAPLSRWRILDSFDTAEKCSNMSNTLRNRSDPNEPWQAKRLLLGACIATDDPRLKEK
jgi:hypothetical protein